MTVASLTVNQSTGVGGNTAVDLWDVVSSSVTVSGVVFTVECLTDGASTPFAITAVRDSGPNPIAGTFDAVTGIDTLDFFDSLLLGAAAGPTFTGYNVADGTKTVTWTPGSPLAMTAASQFDVYLEASDSGAAGDSNYRLIAVSVYYGGEAPPGGSTYVPLPVQVDVYEDDNATLVCSLTHNETTPADARQVRALRGRVSLDEAGDGELTVDYDHPQVAELTGGRFVRVIEGDRTPLAFRIDRDRDVRIPPPGSGDADKTFTVRGAGPLDYMRLGRVLPWLAVGAKPVSRRRRFDWSSPQLDTTDWTSPYDQDRLTSEPGKPFGIPALFTTKWIWGEAEDDTMTIGECCFRRIFEITGTDPVQVSAFASADDGFEDAWQAVNVVEANEAFPGKVWHRPYRSPVLLEPGEYVYAAKARNDGGKGAFICDAWSVGAGGLLDQVFMSGVPEDNE